MSLPDIIAGDAKFSDCGTYRYVLSRQFAAFEGSRDASCVFVMLNPSTADAETFDPTVRRCAGYATAWGFRRLHVVNLFALRSTDPRGLREVDDPIGPANDDWIREACHLVDVRIVLAWGTHGSYLGRGREVARLIAQQRGFGGARDPIPGVVALRWTKAGHPAHPLYLPADITPEPLTPGLLRRIP